MIRVGGESLNPGVRCEIPNLYSNKGCSGMRVGGLMWEGR